MSAGWFRKGTYWLRRSAGELNGSARVPVGFVGDMVDSTGELNGSAGVLVGTVAFMVCDGDLDLMVTCDGFYDDGLTITLRCGMKWSKFQAFPMDSDKSLKGHLACLSKAV
uniref:Uncharacterized protein n=1 Tax=Fagus sylvatica TaxID=28930 RepID=A0A2N9FTK4_FAGSY